jgi:hypothetical protein
VKDTTELNYSTPLKTEGLGPIGTKQDGAVGLLHDTMAFTPQGVRLRTRQDRLLAEGQGHLWTTLSEKEIDGTVEIHVPRRGNRPARKALLEVRFAKVTLNPQRLDDLATMYKFMALSLAPQLLSPLVSSPPRYG